MQPIIKSVASFLERAEILDQGTTVRGCLSGQLITFSLKSHDENPDVKWTEATVTTRCLSFVRIRFSDHWQEEQIARGRGVDHVLNDRAFDDAFIVEGAPERVVRELLDEEVREAMLRLTPKVDGPVPRDAVLYTIEGAFVYHLPHWIDDDETAELLLRTIARIGNGAQRAEGDPSKFSAYRGKTVIGAASAHEDREVAELMLKVAERDKLQRRRDRLRLLIFLGFMAGGVVIWLFVRTDEAPEKSRSTGSAASR